MSKLLSLEIKGLQELRDSFSTLDRQLKQEITTSLGKSVLELRTVLQSEIVKRYNISPSRFVNALAPQSSSRQTVGTNVIEVGLTFKNIPLALSTWKTYTWEWGNINFPAKREGRVHSITIINNKIVYGNQHYGGFIPVTKKNSDVVNGGMTDYNYVRTWKGSAQMFERTGPDRDAPLKLLFGPSVSDMVRWTFDNNATVINKVNSISDNLFNDLDKIL